MRLLLLTITISIIVVNMSLTYGNQLSIQNLNLLLLCAKILVCFNTV